MLEKPSDTLQTGTHRNFLLERVVHGRPAAEVIVQEAEKLGKSRIFITTSGSLSADDALPREIGRALGEKFVGLYSGITAHTPRQCVIEGAAAARAAQADLLVAVGGGSVIDGTKAMLLCLWHDLKDPKEMDAHRGEMSQDPSVWPANAASRIRMLAVPTMFSAAEFTWFAGVSEPAHHVKEPFAHPLLVPQVVVLDPVATLATPIPLLLATGMKAVDHAVERLCGLDPPPLADAAASSALKLLYTSLPQLGGPNDNLKMRMDCQFGMWLSIFGAGSGSPAGASHAIGHVIGGYGVPHGHTTGICLPSVLRWNYDANAARQAHTGRVIGVTGDKLADAVRAFATKLGVPTRLRDAGIKRDQLDDIALKSLHDGPMKTNPKPVTCTAQVMEILEMAW
ncbi:iron-containing alcohol dehydrogenase [Bradyrhizobium vignae]|uniref:iron-containing alcohol dehydrogenase n=1 Tax=Bradyrhizobium vignae TaxID=1549949 RepID=UPI0013E8E99F|nr:iron-containing alcohol dehydrogenase [Bradyrhizobium vignae]